MPSAFKTPLPLPETSPLTAKRSALIFGVFAYAYFLSSMVRAITATLSGHLVSEFALSAGDLGLLAGGYFLGFALTQIPMGFYLDRLGPKRIELWFLSVAVLGCLCFSQAHSFEALWLSRLLTGIGLSACLMAPLTGFRRWFPASMQMRASSWMLTVGSSGVLASTLPVQWMLPLWGWRAVFLALALGLMLAMLLVWCYTPRWQSVPDKVHAEHTSEPEQASGWRGYVALCTRAAFVRFAALGCIAYGGLIAMQTLWAGPWLVHVSGLPASEAAGGLFALNLGLLCSYFAWGWIFPILSARGVRAAQVIIWVYPWSFVVQCQLIFFSASTNVWTWVLFAITSSCVSLSQPAVGLAFEPRWAGRVLSAFNLVIFLGVFVIQWMFGAVVDLLSARGWHIEEAYPAAMGVFSSLCLLVYVFFVWQNAHDQHDSQNRDNGGLEPSST
jgi:predicted MFS family arabinose efflux permease